MVEYAIRAENLTRDFRTVRAVDHLSIEVPTGCIFGFLGPNGAGKTTTIRLLLGLLEPTDGGAEVLGFDVEGQADDVRQRTGALLEHSGLYERLSAKDNLEFYGRICHLSADQRKARIKDLLTHLGLWDRRKERVGDWSRGMKQKLAVARALLHHPALIFLDEPTAGLDPSAAVNLREDLSTLAASEGVTVFITTHNLAEAEKLCHLVGVIRQGALVACNSPEGLRARGDRSRVVIKGRGFTEELLKKLGQEEDVVGAETADGQLIIDMRQGSATASLIRWMVNEGAEVEEVQKASLEDIFLEMMKEEE